MKEVQVVGAVIINENNKILCALRSQTMSLPGVWEFPGGKIEDGERAQESLAREIREELDCQIEVGNLVTEVTHQYPNVTVHLSTYHARITHGEPRPKEHEKLVWLHANELMSLNWAPADIPTVEVLIAYFT